MSQTNSYVIIITIITLATCITAMNLNCYLFGECNVKLDDLPRLEGPIKTYIIESNPAF